MNFAASKLAVETEKNEDEGLNMHRVMAFLMLYIERDDINEGFFHYMVIFFSVLLWGNWVVWVSCLTDEV